MVIRWFVVNIRCLVGLRKHWFIFITVIAFNCTCGFVWFNCFIIDLRQSRGPSLVAWTRSQKSMIIPQSSSVFFSSVIFSKVRKRLLLETIRRFLKFRYMSYNCFELPMEEPWQTYHNLTNVVIKLVSCSKPTHF